MDNQKIENLLNLALDASPEEREKSESLNVGYNRFTNTWNLIVRYVNSLDRVRRLGVSAIELLNNYAILTLQQELIDLVADMEEIVYVEKPKRLNFAITNGVRTSCISPVQDEGYNLHGEGCLVGIIDSGIDFRNHVFRNGDGTTRIVELWDQAILGTPPMGYDIGTVYTENEINEELSRNATLVSDSIVRSVDTSGHGTAVASIAAGNFSQDKSRDVGVATRSKLIVVKLGNPLEGSFPRTSELMMGIDFCIKKSIEYNLPLALNLSFGNSYGSHDGSSLLETYIDEASSVGVNTICVGSGNEGAAAGHTSGVISQGERKNVEISVAMFEPGLNIQIWKSYIDKFTIDIVTPSGKRNTINEDGPGMFRYVSDNTDILVYYGEPSPFSSAQEIYIDLIPTGNYVAEGIWSISIYGERVVVGNYDMWLPSESYLSGSRFLAPVPETTLTIPSTANKVITVGAYNALNFSYADFSGRGYTRRFRNIKPDIVAPGVDIMAAAVGGGYTIVSGTSIATPFATGSAALLMQWGIVNRNDPFLYSQKIKAYFIRGARQLPGFSEWPNPQMGWGALCVADSIPR